MSLVWNSKVVLVLNLVLVVQSKLSSLISARASCTRKLLRLFWRETLCKKSLCSGIELICEFPKQCLMITKTCVFNFLIASAHLASLQKLLKGRQVWRVQIAHLHSAARGLSSPSWCFQFSTNLDKYLFCCLLFWDATTIFTNAKRLLTWCVFRSHSGTSHSEI